VVLSFFSGDVWALVFLAIMLKLPLIGIAVALWMAFKRYDEVRPELTPLQSRMALCAYCGTRITVGYDADVLHEQAHRIGSRTGEAVFEVDCLPEQLAGSVYYEPSGIGAEVDVERSAEAPATARPAAPPRTAPE